MGSRKSGIFRERREEVNISTCDHCGADIEEIDADGNLKGIYPDIVVEIGYFKSDFPEDKFVNICSFECLEIFARSEIIKKQR